MDQALGRRSLWHYLLMGPFHHALVFAQTPSAHSDHRMTIISTSAAKIAVPEQRTDSPFSPDCLTLRVVLTLGLAYCVVFHCNSSQHLRRTGVKHGFILQASSFIQIAHPLLQLKPQMCLPTILQTRGCPSLPHCCHKTSLSAKFTVEDLETV